MHEIVKYPPQNYINGIYEKDEWTDYSDIGKVFDDKLFTLEEYLSVEKKYINVILKILEELNCTYIRLDRWFKNYAEDIKDSRFPDVDYPLLRFAQSLKRGKCINKINIDKIIKLILRNYLGARLRNKKKKLLIEFGWDFYMHVQCELEEIRLREIVEKEGLYLNPRQKRILIIKNGENPNL